MGKVKIGSLFLAACLIGCDAPESKAQGTLDAITFGPGSRLVGLFFGGAGWSFVPTTDILVTGISGLGQQVSFWQSPGQGLATFTITSPSYNFESILPLLLSAGQTYFISCQNPNFSGIVIGEGHDRLGTGGGRATTFETALFISQFESYLISTSGQWSSTGSDYLTYGPNFQFQVVPEPTACSLLLLFSCIRLGSRFLSSSIHITQKTRGHF
jgi:hypothetical protein